MLFISIKAPGELYRDDEDDAEPEECDCDGLDGFPCWPCVKSGRKELPN